MWLASYPKSGNTWFRVLLTNYLRDEGQPVDINALDMQSNAADRWLIDSALMIESSDLIEEELSWYRAEAYRILARRSRETLYLKIHDACPPAEGDEPLIPADVTQGAVYLVRNPLDVSISFAHYYAMTVDAAIERMGMDEAALAKPGPRLHPQVNQRLSTWSRHVSSWIDQTRFPVHLMRYEDMLRQPVESFSAAIRLLGLPCDEQRVRTAVEFSTFARLRDQERARGFTEKPSKAEFFFRSGRADAWHAVLTEAQVFKITADHGPVMRRLGYLPKDE